MTPRSRSSGALLAARTCLSVLVLSCGAFVARQTLAADQPVLLRYGDHPGFGRIVFDIESSDSVVVEQAGNVVRVLIRSKVKIPSGRPPRNVRGVVEEPEAVMIELAAGGRIRRSIVNSHLVIDVLDTPPVLAAPKPPPPAPPATQSKSSVGSGIVKVSPSAVLVPQPAVSPAPPNNPLDAPSRVAATNVEALATPPATERGEAQVPFKAEALSVPNMGQPNIIQPPLSEIVRSPMTASSLSAETDAVPEAGPGHMLSLPFGPNVGAAAFRRGGEMIVVFDERKPIDLHALKNDAVFGRASVQLLPSATVVKISLEAPAELRLERRKAVWAITAIGGDAIASALKSIPPELKNGRLMLKADQPGQVVSVPDPATGGVLQVGTQRTAGQAIAVARRTPDFAMLPTWQGVVVEALSDGVLLRPLASGFIIGADGSDAVISTSQLDSAAQRTADASQLSRIFDFPNLQTDRLLRRMQGAVVTAAAMPASARGGARQGVAESMMALGMAAEARSVLDLATAGDARTEQIPAVRALAAAAGLLSGRLAEADALDDSFLDGSDEIALWRAVKTAMRIPESAAAADVFANTAPLLVSYPMDLQQRLLPMATETMALGGQVAAAQKILESRAGDPALDLARAFVEQRQGGDPSEAISMFKKLAVSPDRLVRIRAARAGAELQLAAGQMNAGQAAQALSKLLYAWRGDDREVDLRLRVAQLHAQANEWRSALQLLRETAQLWPERGDQLKARLAGTFAASISPSSQAGVRPFDLVTMAEENADLMPDGDAGLRLVEQVTDALTELDLPGRVIPSLEKMMANAPNGAARAAFGGRLAQMRLEQGDSAGAVDALKSTVTETLPPDLLQSRTLIFASAVARLGDMLSAINALTQLDTLAGDLRLAELSEQAQRWPDAVTAMRRVVSRVIPPSGNLDEDQGRILLRLASAAAEAGDVSVLGQLRDRDLSKMPQGKTAELLRLMLTTPIGSVGDLPRASREIIAARSVAPIAVQAKR